MSQGAHILINVLLYYNTHDYIGVPSVLDQCIAPTQPLDHQNSTAPEHNSTRAPQSASSESKDLFALYARCHHLPVRYRATAPLRHFATSLLRHIATSLLRYSATSTPVVLLVLATKQLTAVTVLLTESAFHLFDHLWTFFWFQNGGFAARNSRICIHSSSFTNCLMF